MDTFKLNPVFNLSLEGNEKSCDSMAITEALTDICSAGIYLPPLAPCGQSAPHQVAVFGHRGCDTSKASRCAP